MFFASLTNQDLGSSLSVPKEFEFLFRSEKYFRSVEGRKIHGEIQIKDDFGNSAVFVVATTKKSRKMTLKKWISYVRYRGLQAGDRIAFEPPVIDGGAWIFNAERRNKDMKWEEVEFPGEGFVGR